MRCRRGDASVSVAELQMTKGDTISSVKREIERASGIPIHEQTLVCEGEVLDDNVKCDNLGNYLQKKRDAALRCKTRTTVIR